MLLPRLSGALLLAASTAQAFKNASPFFVLSSDPISSDAPLKRAQIALSKDIENRLIETLRPCDKKWYYIFSQDSVTAEDLRGERMKKLQGMLESVEEAKFLGIPDLVEDGGLRAVNVQEGLREVCGKMGKKEVQSFPEGQDEYRIVEMQLPDLPTERAARAKTLKDTDDALADTVSSVLSKDGSAILIYTTTPPADTVNLQDGEPYEMDDPYPSSLHTDLKRDLTHHTRRSEDDHMQDGLPLFEKYQFFSPPIFMGLSVSILLLAILAVALSAISGLEVSYKAFDKENGPQAQKNKQQQ